MTFIVHAVRSYKKHVAVTGMNMASEATLAIELGLRYANISTVDKYATGSSRNRQTIKTSSKPQRRAVRTWRRC